MSYAVAFILAIGVEFPTMRLENMFFFRCTKHEVTGLTRATGNQARLRKMDVYVAVSTVRYNDNTSARNKAFQRCAGDYIIRFAWLVKD